MRRRHIPLRGSRHALSAMPLAGAFEQSLCCLSSLPVPLYLLFPIHPLTQMDGLNHGRRRVCSLPPLLLLSLLLWLLLLLLLWLLLLLCGRSKETPRSHTRH